MLMPHTMSVGRDLRCLIVHIDIAHQYTACSRSVVVYSAMGCTVRHTHHRIVAGGRKCEIHRKRRLECGLRCAMLHWTRARPIYTI